MKNMKVRAKMLTGFIIVTIIGMIIGIVGITSILMIKSISDNIRTLQVTSAGASNVLNAHYIWRHGLTTAVYSGSEFTGSLDPGACALGKWLESDEAKSITDPKVLELLQSVDAPHRYIHTEAGVAIEHLKAGESDLAEEILVNSILPRTQEVITLLTDIQTQFSDLIEEENLAASSRENVLIVVIIALIVVAAVISMFLALYISGLISRLIIPMSGFFKKAGSTGDIEVSPEDQQVIGKYIRNKDELGALTVGAVSFIEHLTNISGALEAVASGDLTVEINPLSNKDVLGLSLEKMTIGLNEMFGEVNEASSQVSVGSKQVADGAQALAQGSTEQAAAIEELSSSMSEISDKTKTTAGMADKAATLTEAIKGNAEKGTRQMDEMMAAVNEINNASQSISKVIKTIDDIAFQTNILALNAAVEAARAGQHGKGFAVVAEEVRNLAAKSAEAAKETGGMIENSMEKANIGVRIAGETAGSFSEIVSGINESDLIVREIAKSSEDQSVSIDRINIGIDQVAQVVSQNSATAQESAAASEEMSGQSALLQDLISQFKINDGRATLRSLPHPEK